MHFKMLLRYITGLQWVRFLLQLALTLAGAYLSFYVANGPCEFSGENSSLGLALTVQGII